MTKTLSRYRECPSCRHRSPGHSDAWYSVLLLKDSVARCLRGCTAEELSAALSRPIALESDPRVRWRLYPDERYRGHPQAGDPPDYDAAGRPIFDLDYGRPIPLASERKRLLRKIRARREQAQ